MDLLDLTLTQAVRAIRTEGLSVERYAEALIQQTEACAGLNAYLRFEPKRLRARAGAAASRRSGDLQALFGVPIGVKDNIDTADFPTSAGTKALRNHRPPHNAPVVDALLAEGAIISGKLNMHELAFGVTTNNLFSGPTRNPYDPSRIVGGSSGGNAAAIAARMIPGALGTDTGGSTRTPAAFCGITGLRPTLGRYDQAGVVPISHTRDTVGPMARTVADVAYLDGVLTGADLELGTIDMREVRLGVPRTPFYEDLHPDIEKTGERLLALLKDMGAELISLDMTDVVELTQAVTGPVCFYEILLDLPRYLRQSGAATSLDEIVEQVASLDVRQVFVELMGPGRVGRAQYDEVLLRGRPNLRSAYHRHFASHGLDALVFPTTRLPAPPLGDDTTTLHNGRVVATFPCVVANTDPAGNAGLPGISIPVGLTESGLPIGFEFDGLSSSDRHLLNIAHAVQSSLPAIPAPPVGLIAAPSPAL